MASYNQSPSNAAEWKTYYSNLKKDAEIPPSPVAVIDPQNAIFHSMYVDLSEVKSQLLTASANPLRTVVYCDVLNIPDNMKWTVKGTSLMIVARLIYWGKSSAINLDFRNNESGALVVFAGNHIGSGKYIALSDPNNTTDVTRTSDYSSEGYLIKLQSGTVVKKEMKYDQGINDLVQDHFKLYLNDTFLYGSILVNMNEQLSLDIQTWVSFWARESLGLSGLFYRSASLSAVLQSRINARSQGARFVPRLSKTIYEQLSSVFVAAAQQYEDSYNKFIVGGKLTSQNLELANSMKDNKQYESDYTQNLLSQARENLQRALQTKSVAQYAFNAEQCKAELIKIRFQEEGIPKYQREMILKAILDIVMAIATIVAAIAAIAVGQVEAAPAAAGAAGGAAKGIKGAADVGEVAINWVENPLFEPSNVADVANAIDKIEEVGKTTGSLAKSLKQLKLVIESMQKIVIASSTVFKKAAKLTKGGKDTSATDAEYSSLQNLLSGNTTTSLSPSDAWDAFLVEFDFSMESAINADDGKGIDFAADYKIQIHKVAIFGKSLAKAQEGVIQTSNQISALMLQQGLAKQQNERLQQYVNNVTISEANFVDMQQIFYSRLLDMKGNLFSAFQNYKDSYYYWALKASSIKPSILSSVKEIGTGIEDIAKIKIDQETAFKSFSPAPGPFRRKEIKIVDVESLKSLKNNHSVTIAVPSDSSVFANLERVRFNNVQVWLDGASHGSEAITIDIVCSGVFIDNYKGNKMNFVSEPLAEKFQYRTFTDGSRKEDPDFWLDNGSTKAFSEHDAKISDEMKFAYAMPTPFTEWTIDVDPKKNGGVNLDNLNAIIIVLEGTAI